MNRLNLSYEREATWHYTPDLLTAYLAEEGKRVALTLHDPWAKIESPILASTIAMLDGLSSPLPA